MKPSQLDLEDFGAPSLEQPQATAASEQDATLDAQIEAVRVEAYENGYKTGWEDATKACDEEGKLVAEELSRNLKDIEFTYFEAREEISKSMTAFMNEMLSSLFPTLLGDSVAMIVEDIISQADSEDADTLELVVSPDDAGTVRGLLEQVNSKDIALVEEPAMASGQASVRISDSAYSVDAARIVERIRETASNDQSVEQLVSNG